MDCIACYCDKCGAITIRLQEKCALCPGGVLQPIPKEYLDEDDLFKSEFEDEIIEKFVKTSPNFDQYYFEHREEIVENNHRQYEMAKAFAKEKSGKVKCIYCGSTNVNKISTGSRILSVGLFGLGSKKIGKQWHCKNCGYTW